MPCGQAISGSDGDVRVAVRVQPGARRPGLRGMYGPRLRIAVDAPPVDGKANRAVVALFAALVGVRPSAVRIGLGAGSRDKRVDIDAPLHQVEQAISTALIATG